MKDNQEIFLLLGLFIAANVLMFSTNIYWDSAVYVGMGKYIYSFGESGLWEASRPLVWPVFLGLFWKIGLSALIFGKILGILFHLGMVYLTYLIGKKVFTKDIALLASFFVGTMPVFLNADKLLTGIPSTFFGLLAVYMFLEKKYFYTGLFSGIAFMTRFPQLLIFIFLVIFLKKKNLIKAFYGFLIPVIPYLVFNFILYKNPLHPFLLQVSLTKVTGWPWWEPWFFYFLEIIKQNFLLLTGIPFLIKKKTRKIALLFLVLFLFYQFNVHKEVRFMITFLPYFVLLAAAGIYSLTFKSKQLTNSLFLVLILVYLIQVVPQYERIPENDIISIENQEYWVTNPLYVVNSDSKANLMYYPTFDTERAEELKLELLNAEQIIWNSCDIPCPPWDISCEEEKEKLFEIISGNFRTVSTMQDECQLILFRK